MTFTCGFSHAAMNLRVLARRVADLQLVGQELHRQPRHIQRILKKAAHRPYR
jgi:hypothetical protein